MASPSNDEHGRYGYEFDPERENDTAAAIYQLSAEGGKKVLDLGCGRGIVSGALVADGCTVVGVDVDPELLADAASRGLTTIQADLSGEWADEVRADGPFDVVILADVLEHLEDPGVVLDTIRDGGLLAPEGWLVISIPNASHEALIVNLLTDRFTYTEDGLLDRTHIRWFTASSFSEFAERHGYARTRHIRVRRTLEQTAFGYLSPELVETLREQLLRNDEHRTFQHVMRFEPMTAATAVADMRRQVEDERKGAFVALETERATAAALQSALEQSESALEQSESALEQSESALDAVRPELTAAREKTVDASRQFRDLQRHYDEQFEARKSLVRRNRELERKLDGVYRSESFRLGAAILKNPRRVKRVMDSFRRRTPSGRISSDDGERGFGDAAASLIPPRSDLRRHRPAIEASPLASVYYAAITASYPATARYRVAITVSTIDLSEGRGDPYTAVGLGRHLEKLGIGVCYLPPEQWHDPPIGTDVVLSLLAEPRFGCLDPLRLPRGIRRVAWIRNNTDRWVAEGALELYDGLLCSSERTRRIVDRLVDIPTAVLPLAVDDELFDPSAVAGERQPSIVATINQWGSERHAYVALAEAELDVPVGIYGTQQGLDPRLGGLQNGMASFFEMPSLYRSAMFALDDQQAGNQLFNNTNSRVFESILMGAIPLTDTPSGPEVDGLDEVPVWTNSRELSEIILTLSSDDEARCALSGRLQETVRARHTYAHRAETFDCFISETVGLGGEPSQTVDTIVGFWPDYRITNPFQGFLYSELGSANAAAVALEEPLDLLAPIGHRGEQRVLHLHWTAPILNQCPSQGAARRKLTDMLDGLDDFAAGGGRLIWTIHNLMPHESHYPDLEARLRQGIVDRANVVHVMCPETVALAADSYTLRDETVRIIEHGSYSGWYPNAAAPSDARRRFGFSDDDIVLLVFGQIRPYKGLEDLLDVFPVLRTRETRLRLLVAGKVGKFPGTPELIDRLMDAPGVTFVHEEIPDDEIQDYYAACDIAVLPYRTGLNSGALQLAFSFGRPAVAPQIGCLPHGVPDDIARFYPAGPEGLRDALRDLSGLLEVDARIAALAHANAYTHIDMARAYADLVREIAGSSE